jgi:hypothetical protein
VATALALNARNTIVNGQGLAVNSSVLQQISAYQNHSTVKLIGNIFSQLNTATSNVKANLSPVLSNIGLNVVQGQWLIDFYPVGSTPVSSNGVYYYSSVTSVTLTPSVVITSSPAVSTASFSHTLQNQVTVPFYYGMAGFANVFSTVYSYALSTFDTISSITMLKDKTYAQSGIGYTGPSDLATNGIGPVAQLVSNAVSKWGTMYDVTNMSKISDIYVFGQNLLNQGLGSYGNLSTNLTAAGLDVTNLPKVPKTTITYINTSSGKNVKTILGNVVFPSVSNVAVVNTVKGSSADTVLNIYQQISGSNLSVFTSTTGCSIQNPAIQNLADYLDYTKVVDPLTRNQLLSYGVNDFTGLGNFLSSRFAKGNFSSWKEVADLANNLEIPKLAYTSTTANTKILPDAVSSSILAQTGSGTGPLNNFLITDFLGAVAGIPYQQLLANVNSNLDASVTADLLNNLSALDSAVASYIVAANAADGSYSPAPPISTVVSLVNAVNNSLNSVPSSYTFVSGSAAYSSMVAALSSEVANLTKAGATFNTARSDILVNFGQSLPNNAADKTQYQLYQFFGNLITADTAGDTLKSAIAETININLLSRKSIAMNNDPNPQTTILQAQNQNLPISTYLSRNR